MNLRYQTHINKVSTWNEGQRIDRYSLVVVETLIVDGVEGWQNDMETELTDNPAKLVDICYGLLQILYRVADTVDMFCNRPADDPHPIIGSVERITAQIADSVTQTQPTGSFYQFNWGRTTEGFVWHVTRSRSPWQWRSRPIPRFPGALLLAEQLITTVTTLARICQELAPNSVIREPRPRIQIRLLTGKSKTEG